MRNLIKSIARILREEEGLTTVEYAIAGSLVSVALVTAFTTLGQHIANSINTISNLFNY